MKTDYIKAVQKNRLANALAIHRMHYLFSQAGKQWVHKASQFKI